MGPLITIIVLIVCNEIFSFYSNAHCLFLSFNFKRHRLTRHQYYLQLRRDVLEDRVYCNEETALFLAALALQAEFGDYMPEVSQILMSILIFNWPN